METKTVWLIVLIAVIAAHYPLLLGEYYAIGDVRDVYIPLEQFFQKGMDQGFLPAWNPQAAWGFPVIASAQIGFFYPPLLALRLLPLALYLPLIFIGHLVALALGTYLLIKRLGPSSSAALLGALTFTLGGFTTLHTTHLNIIFTLAWLPWQLWFISTLPPVKISVRHQSILALLIGLPFLAGQLQIPLLIAIISVVWLLYTRPANKLATLKTVTITALLAFLIAAAQLLPTFELLQESSRTSTQGFDITRANQHSYPLYHLPTTLFPRFFANDDTYWGKRLQIEYGFYLGTIPIVLALWQVARSLRVRTKGRMSRHDTFWYWLAAITFLLALGNLSPFRLLGLEPSLWVFSAPARWLLFTSLALSVLTAKGFDSLIKDPAAAKRLLKNCLIALLTIVVLANVAFLTITPTTLTNYLPSHLSDRHIEKLASMYTSANKSSLSLTSPYTWLPLLALTALFFSLKKPKIQTVIIAITAVELIILASTTTPSLPWSKITTSPSTIEQLPESVRTNNARLYSTRDGGDTGAYFTNPDSRANAAKRATQRQLLVPLTHSQHNLASIEWPASLDIQAHTTQLEQLRTEDSYQISNIPLAEQLNIGAVLQETNGNIQVETFNAKPRASFTDTNNQEQALSYPTKNPNHLTFHVNALTESTLTLRDTHYPGWHAYVNTQEVPITPYKNIFRQIPIPPGNHVVEFKYQPQSLYLGMIISSIALAGAALLIVRYKF